ncbi:VirB3 family type IV secretion system protein [bacterium]|nr:VirB3 family type IV secretion system protein [bacterium]
MNRFSIIYRAVLLPSLIMGVPRNWFVISFVFYLLPYNFGYALYGLIFYIFSIAVGFLLTKYFDPDFADIILEKLKYVSLTFSKTYHD